jgi:hypothetical protein
VDNRNEMRFALKVLWLSPLPLNFRVVNFPRMSQGQLIQPCSSILHHSGGKIVVRFFLVGAE